MAVRKLQTQTETFWRDEYEVSESDLDLVTGIILEAGKPQPLSALASAIVVRRFRREKEAVARRASSGQVYQPKGQYEPGQELVFTALDFAVGRVVSVRPGRNAKYEPFSVIRVAFEDGKPEREFVANFTYPHPLNRPAEDLLGSGDPELGEAEIVRLFEPYVARHLGAALQANKSFCEVGGKWFLNDLLPQLHVGHLNLAEAMIYEAKRPLTTHEILKDLELPATSAPDAQVFALNHALSEDARFDNISLSEEPAWYLRALEPEAAFERPIVLKPAFCANGGEYLGITMLDDVEEIGDELDDIEGALPAGEADSVHFKLIFPHLYAGTMPLTAAFLRMLPTSLNPRIMLTMVDARTEQRFQAWALPAERYICGLSDWYKSTGLCVGGEISVTHASEPLTFTIMATPTRNKRSEWVCAASVVEEELVLQMQRAIVAVRCDRHMLVDVPDHEAVARLMARMMETRFSLHTLVRTAFDELAKLSGRGFVQAKGVYSVANLLCRTGAVPVFAELMRCACYDPVGDGSWAYDASLEGTIYSTPEEMQERPQSHRQDRLKYQVVQYQGR